MSKLPLSGSEKNYTRKDWTSYVRANNCYAYAMSDLKRFRPQKSVPGNRSGKTYSAGYRFLTCGNLGDLVTSDNPKNVYKTNPKSPCQRGFYKIMMFVAPTNSVGDSEGDFHFYKQHGKVEYIIRAADTYTSIAKFFGVSPTTVKKYAGELKPGKKIKFPVNLWSHKMGWATGPLLVDSKGKVIKDPRKAAKDYSYNYSKYCNSFCVRSGGSTQVGRNRNIKIL